VTRTPEIYQGDTLRRSGRATLLAVFALLGGLGAVVSLIMADLVGVGIKGGAGLLFLTAAWLTNRGLAAERAYDKRAVAAAPKLPQKLIGALVTGLAATLIARLGLGYGLLLAVVHGGAAVTGHIFLYGPDPRADKGEAAGGFTAEEIQDTIEEAEAKIAAMEAAREAIGNAELSDRLTRIAGRARDVLSALEANPKDIRRARRFLHVYLDGAQQVAVKYAQTHQQSAAPELESGFRRVLASIEKVFGEQYEKLLADDVLDLDIQMEVLADQMEKEGVA